MTKKSNVVQLFGTKEKPKKTTDRISEGISQSTTNIVNAEGLKLPHTSWSRDNMIGAIASNVYSGNQSSTFILQSTKYDNNYLLKELKGFIERSFNKGLNPRGLYCKWAGNGIFIYTIKDDEIRTKVRVELELTKNHLTDIAFYVMSKKLPISNLPCAKILDGELGIG